jgi:(p)ppGpp synthase/HD superfamily hydrolase
MTDLTHRFEDAVVFANRAHRHQRRKGTTIPYVAHLLGVASIALEIGADEDQAIAALLHDAVEDQGGLPMLEEIRARFGDRVADIVAACTDGEPDAETGEKPPWRDRKEAYIAGMAHKSADALLVSLADKTHNARAILDDLIVHGEPLWDRFTAGRDGSLWYYDALARAFAERLPGQGAGRLTGIVAEMHLVAAAKAA